MDYIYLFWLNLIFSSWFLIVKASDSEEVNYVENCEDAGCKRPIRSYSSGLCPCLISFLGRVYDYRDDVKTFDDEENNFPQPDLIA